MNVIAVLDFISRDLYLLFAIRFSSKFQNPLGLYTNNGPTWTAIGPLKQHGLYALLNAILMHACIEKHMKSTPFSQK